MKLKRLPRLTVLVALLGLALTPLLVWGLHVSWQLYSLRQALGRAEALLDQPAGKATPQEALALTQELAGHSEALRADLQPLFPLLRLAGQDTLPGQVEPLVCYAENLAQAGQALLLGVEPLWAAPGGEGGQEEFGQRLLAVLEAGRPQFQRARQELAQAAQMRTRIDAQFIPTTYRSAYRRLDENFDLLVQGVELLQFLPDLLGGSQPRRYLVLAQNRDELRPTGGFISGVGVLHLERGAIRNFEIGDSYRVDDLSKSYPPPPEPMQRYMRAGLWLVRDANWSPDFPTSAYQAQQLYQLSRNQATDGVVAFDQQALRAVLEVVGAVQLEGVAAPVDAAGLDRYMQLAWAPAEGQGFDRQWWSQRKDFMSELGRAVLKRVLALRQPGELAALSKALFQQVKSGHLALYSTRPGVQAALAQADLDGAVRAGRGDFLLWVDTNLGFNKVDAAIQRSLAYTVDLRNLAAPQAGVQMRYRHLRQGQAPCKHEAVYGKTYAEMQVRCYWDYWRVLTVPGSRLLSARAAAVPGEWLLSGQGWDGTVETLPVENGARAFAGLLVLPVGQSQEVALNFALPPEVIQPLGGTRLVYHLRVQKQAGLGHLPLEVQLLLPVGVELAGPPAGWQAQGAGQWRWQGDLLQAQEFELVLAP